MTVPSAQDDPWASVEDLDGLAHYRVLGLQKKASAEDVRRAYRERARQHHPDKGGSAQAFARLQAAFEVLADPKKRVAYDDWARELRFRYIPGVSAKACGGEGVLLDNLGLACDPATQLVVICEVCRRPSTKECWTCGMRICDFCTLKRHWKGAWPLHWPLINSAHMRGRLARRELEQKRVEDAKRLALQDPSARSESELAVIRAFKLAAAKTEKGSYDLALARFYMWAQTEAQIFLAVLVPTGYADMELVVECSEGALLIQPERSPPVIDRAFDYRVDTAQPLECFRTEDNRCLGLALAKAQPGERWRRLFRGDPDGARCLLPPYRLAESDADVLLELDVPFWICAEDIAVRILPDALHVTVRNELALRRAYWRRDDAAVVDCEESLWSLLDGEEGKTLMVSLAKPALTETEATWKRGRRQDNRAAPRGGGLGNKEGFRFFADDEDEFGLEDLLQALCFRAAGHAWVPAKPWQQPQQHGSWVAEAHGLSPGAQQHFVRLAAT